MEWNHGSIYIYIYIDGNVCTYMDQQMQAGGMESWKYDGMEL